MALKDEFSAVRELRADQEADMRTACIQIIDKLFPFPDDLKQRMVWQRAYGFCDEHAFFDGLCVLVEHQFPKSIISARSRLLDIYKGEILPEAHVEILIMTEKRGVMTYGQYGKTMGHALLLALIHAVDGEEESKRQGG